LAHLPAVSTEKCSPTRVWTRRFCLLLLLLFAVSGVDLNTAVAGCHSPHTSAKVVFEGSEAGRLVARNVWSSAPVIRVYTGGQFVYYEAPLNAKRGVPCDGPGCQGKEPSNSLKPATNSQNEPSAKEFGRSGCTLSDQRPPQGWTTTGPRSHSPPFFGVPRKPPRPL
jgi:hypothetical protein